MNSAQRQEFEQNKRQLESKVLAERSRREQLEQRISEDDETRKLLQAELTDLTRQNDILKRDYGHLEADLRKEFEVTLGKAKMEWEEQNVDIETQLAKKKMHRAQASQKMPNSVSNPPAAAGQDTKTPEEQIEELKSFQEYQKETINELKTQLRFAEDALVAAKSDKDQTHKIADSGRKRFISLVQQQDQAHKDKRRFEMILKYFVVNNYVNNFKSKKNIRMIMEETTLMVRRAFQKAEGEVWVKNPLIKEWLNYNNPESPPGRVARKEPGSRLPMSEILENMNELKSLLEICMDGLETSKDDWKSRANAFFARNNELAEKAITLEQRLKKQDKELERAVVEALDCRNRLNHATFQLQQMSQKSGALLGRGLPTVKIDSQRARTSARWTANAARERATTARSTHREEGSFEQNGEEGRGDNPSPSRPSPSKNERIVVRDCDKAWNMDIRPQTARSYTKEADPNKFTPLTQSLSRGPYANPHCAPPPIDAYALPRVPGSPYGVTLTRGIANNWAPRIWKKDMYASKRNAGRRNGLAQTARAAPRASHKPQPPQQQPPSN